MDYICLHSLFNLIFGQIIRLMNTDSERLWKRILNRKSKEPTNEGDEWKLTIIKPNSQVGKCRVPSRSSNYMVIRLAMKLETGWFCEVIVEDSRSSVTVIFGYFSILKVFLFVLFRQVYLPEACWVRPSKFSFLASIDRWRSHSSFSYYLLSWAAVPHPLNYFVFVNNSVKIVFASRQIAPFLRSNAVLFLLRLRHVQKTSRLPRKLPSWEVSRVTTRTRTPFCPRMQITVDGIHLFFFFLQRFENCWHILKEMRM